MIWPVVLVALSAPSLPFGACATPEARATFEQGRLALVARKADDAVALLDRCLVEDPGCVACQFQLGWAYWVKEDWGLAAVAFDKTLALSPGHAAARKYAARAREREGRESEELGDAPATRPSPTPTLASKPPSPPTQAPSPPTQAPPPSTPTNAAERPQEPQVSVAPPPVIVLPPPPPLPALPRPAMPPPSPVPSPLPSSTTAASPLPSFPTPPPLVYTPAGNGPVPAPVVLALSTTVQRQLRVADALPAPEAMLSVPVGTRGQSERTGSPRLQLIARWQGFQATTPTPVDHFDLDINSPKSVRFSRDGSRVYVNSLEGYRTVVFDPATLTKVAAIEHRFGKDDAPLFFGQNTVFGYAYRRQSPSGDPNVMAGKPVESALSHGGRFLWVPYYRRNFDHGSMSPSAVAIIDTTTNRIVRVMPTGPIPKYVAASPDDRFVVVTHWGDNTLGVIDVSSGDPAQFAYLERRLVVGAPLSLDALTGGDRDKECGSCLRGTVFSPDSATLLVARMGSGGIAAFDTATWTYLGTVGGDRPSPRHLVISGDHRFLYMSANTSGFVQRAPLDDFLRFARSLGGRHLPFPGWQETHVGSGARTIELSPDDRWLYVACNSRAQLVIVDTATMTVAHRIRTDSYTVGLDVSPDGRQVWTTSQGNKTAGGRSVCVYAVRFDGEPDAISVVTPGSDGALLARAPTTTATTASTASTTTTTTTTTTTAIATLASAASTRTAAMTTTLASATATKTTAATTATTATATLASATATKPAATTAAAAPGASCRLTKPTKVWRNGAWHELPAGTPLVRRRERVVPDFTEVDAPDGIARIHDLRLAGQCAG